MTKDVKTFLDSGLLEEYLMGTCDSENLKKVEYYIENYPNVKAEYDSLQDKIEKMANKLAVETPVGLKEAIKSCIEDDSKYKVKSSLIKKKKNYILPIIPWAAAVIGIILASTMHNENQNLRTVNMEVHAEKNMLEHRLESQENDIALLEEKLFISGHNMTSRMLLAGNNLSPGFKSTAFWNNVAGKAILYINDLGEMTDHQCYQIWANVNGEMVNLGVLPHKEGPIEMSYMKDAVSLNITIEPKGGSKHPTISKIISSQELIKI